MNISRREPVSEAYSCGATYFSLSPAPVKLEDKHSVFWGGFNKTEVIQSKWAYEVSRPHMRSDIME